jgi:hypothetical protein
MKINYVYDQAEYEREYFKKLKFLSYVRSDKPNTGYYNVMQVILHIFKTITRM